MRSLCNPVVCWVFLLFCHQRMQKCMCTFVYVQNECVDMCACICTYTVMVWNHAFAEASWTMIFTVGPYCSIWTGGRECLFCRNSMLFSVIDPVGQAMACSTSGEFRILNSCASMHTHTVHSSMHTEERTQLLPLAELWLYSAFVQFQRDLCQQFYILDKCIWMLRSRSFVHLPVPFMLLFSAAR